MTDMRKNVYAPAFFLLFLFCSWSTAAPFPWVQSHHWRNQSMNIEIKLVCPTRSLSHQSSWTSKDIRTLLLHWLWVVANDKLADAVPLRHAPSLIMNVHSSMQKSDIAAVQHGCHCSHQPTTVGTGGKKLHCLCTSSCRCWKSGTPISDRCWHLQVDASALYFLRLLSCEKESEMIRDG